MKSIDHIHCHGAHHWFNPAIRVAEMDHAAKEVVTSKFRTVFQGMRTLESPGGYCSVGRGGLPDSLFRTNLLDNPFNGPSNTEADLNAAVVAKYVEFGRPKHRADFYTRAFEEIFKDHKPVFSHADFQQKNVVLQHPSSTAAREEGEGKGVPWDSEKLDIVLIDWEYGGWYPSYWKYTRAVFACGRWEDDWSYWAEKMLDSFRLDYGWM